MISTWVQSSIFSVPVQVSPDWPNELSRPKAAHFRLGTEPFFDQVLVCHLFGAKSLSLSVVAYRQQNPSIKISISRSPYWGGFFSLHRLSSGCIIGPWRHERTRWLPKQNFNLMKWPKFRIPVDLYVDADLNFNHMHLWNIIIIPCPNFKTGLI